MKKIIPVILIIIIAAILGLYLTGLRVEHKQVPEESTGTLTITSYETESYFIGTNISDHIGSNITIDVTSEETKRIMYSGGAGKSLIDDRPN